MKLTAVFVLVLFGAQSKSQSLAVLNQPVSVYSAFSSSDSVLSIRYKNTSNQKLLIWIGDFLVSAVFNSNAVSASDLASPLSNQIFLFKKNLKVEKLVQSYFFRCDTSAERKLKNYCLIDKDSFLLIKIKINNPILLKEIKMGNIILKGQISLIDAVNLENYLSFDKNLSDEDKSLSKMDIFDTSLNYFHSGRNIFLPNVSWIINLKDSPVNRIDIPLSLPKTTKFDNSSFIKIEGSNAADKLRLPNTAILYKFTSESTFEADIRIRTQGN